MTTMSGEQTARDKAGATTPKVLVNGVFMGGGAKGVAYAGALKALDEKGYAFGSVAGASAGAITASLIAAGLTHAQLSLAVPDGLKAAASSKFEPSSTASPESKLSRLFKAARGHATSIYPSDGLRCWLDHTLRTQIGKTAGGPVTFADLYDATLMELYVVAMDLATAQPVVFCRRTTPNVEVAGAVASSSAIPAAFPGGRGVFHSKEDGAVIHQFVDGGSWANYPAFVFADRSFRAWLRSEADPNGEWTADQIETWNTEDRRPVLGLVLGAPDPVGTRHPVGMVPVGNKVDRRFDQGPTYTSRSKPTYLFGAVLSSDWARGFLFLAVLVWVTLSIATLPIGVRRFSTWLGSWVPDLIYPFVLIGTLTTVALAVVVIVAVVLALVITSRLLADTLVPSVKALVGVPTDVAPWIGMGDDSLVLRVPYGKLETTGFDVKSDVTDPAVEAACVSVLKQLEADTTPDRLRTRTGPEVVAAQSPRRLELTETPPDRASLWLLVVMVAVASTIAVMAWYGTNIAGTTSLTRTMATFAVAVIVGGSALLYVGNRTGLRAASRAEFGEKHGADPKKKRIGTIVALVGVALVVAAVLLSAFAMDDRGDDTSQATIISAQDGVTGSEDNRYTARIDGGGEVSVTNERHLRLGEGVFVEVGPGGEGEIARPLDDWRFPVAMVLSLFGLGLVTSGVRRRKWESRREDLTALVHAFDQPQRSNGPTAPR